MKTFKGKIALVTGSAMGIGLACAEAFELQFNQFNVFLLITQAQ